MCWLPPCCGTKNLAEWTDSISSSVASFRARSDGMALLHRGGSTHSHPPTYPFPSHKNQAHIHSRFTHKTQPIRSIPFFIPPTPILLPHLPSPSRPPIQKSPRNPRAPIQPNPRARPFPFPSTPPIPSSPKQKRVSVSSSNKKKVIKEEDEHKDSNSVVVVVVVVVA